MDSICLAPYLFQASSSLFSFDSVTLWWVCPFPPLKKSLLLEAQESLWDLYMYQERKWTWVIFSKSLVLCLYSFFFKDFISLFFRVGKGGREGEKHLCVVSSHASPIRDPDHNPGMCPTWELNQRPLGSQGSIQSTGPHQPGHLHSS